MTHTPTHTANNPVFRRNTRIIKLRELKTRMEKLKYSTDDIKQNLLHVCLYRWALTTRSANDYIKVAMMSQDDTIEEILEMKESMMVTN